MQSTIVKNTKKIGGDFESQLKKLIWSPNFFNSQVIGFFSCQKINFDTKINFSPFSINFL
jgi:hypothetical protein